MALTCPEDVFFHGCQSQLVRPQGGHETVAKGFQVESRRQTFFVVGCRRHTRVTVAPDEGFDGPDAAPELEQLVQDGHFGGVKPVKRTVDLWWRK